MVSVSRISVVNGCVILTSLFIIGVVLVLGFGLVIVSIMIGVLSTRKAWLKVCPVSVLFSFPMLVCSFLYMGRLESVKKSRRLGM